MDYRCDPWDEPDSYVTNSKSSKIHVQNPPKTDEKTMKFPQPSSPILKKSKSPQPTPVSTTSTTINADDIICLEYKMLSHIKIIDNTTDTSSPPPPQTAPEPPTQTNHHENEEVTECP